MVHLRLHQSFHWRLLILNAFVSLLLAAIAARIFMLAIVEHRRFALAAERQHQLLQIIPSRRGGIFAAGKSGARYPLAIQQPAFSVVAVPKDIRDPAATAGVLGEVLGVAAADLFPKLAKEGDPYEVVARRVDADRALALRGRGLAGVLLVEESRRAYPQGELAASLLGFVSYQDGEERGEYGLERHYDASLRGQAGFFEGERDAGGYWVSLGRRILNPPVNGDDIVLTVDPNIQFKVEGELAALMERWQAESALGIVLEPRTGRILAMASRPGFDPNAYAREEDFSVFLNPAANAQYELGSVFKPITMAAAIDAGLLTASSTYRDPGVVRFGGLSIANFDGQSHGVQTMTQVLEKSLNTGAMYAAERLGPERFREAIARFGFGAKTGVDFPGELAGDVSNLAAGRDVDYATASFGQGIAVTPLQLASAIGAIANRGILMRPYLAERLADANGSEVRRAPREVRRVVSAEAAETISKMLVSVVRNGLDRRGGVEGYFVAGKTGTAQIPRSDRRGYSEAVVHSFVGYAPAFDPRFVAFLQLVRPKGNRFAANTLSPAFRNVAEFILNYYEVPPDEPQNRESRN